MSETGKKEGVSLGTLVARMAATDAAKFLNEMQGEFENIVKQTPGFEQFRMNAVKNRYHGNVYLYDHTRVILKDNQSSDYIHASYISTPRQHRRFILTQAPLPETIDDFWRMIAQEQSQVIVALCEFDGPGTKSDDPFPMYWPRHKGEPQKRGRIQVKYVDSQLTTSLIITTLKLNKGDSQLWHNVTHLQVRAPAWDDGGLPTDHLQALIDAVWEKEEQMARLNYATALPPIVIHCGSGTARSGQFCAFAMVTEAARQGYQMPIKDIIYYLQSQRYGALREPSHVIALCYAVVEYGKRHRLLSEQNVDGMLRLLKENIAKGQ